MQSALSLSRVILGAMGLSELDQASVNRIVRRGMDGGMTSIDTAPLYGAGRSEELVGRAIADCRSRVQILTKCGLRWDDEHGAQMFQMPIDGRMRWVRKDSRPRSIALGIDESLRRLGVETIDLMQIHQLDVATPVADSLEELLRAVESGKILAIGVSNFPVREVEEAQRQLHGRLFSVQDEFSLLWTGRSAKLIESCREERIRFLAYSPLAHGVLAGKLLDAAPSPPSQGWGAPYMAPQNLRKIHTVLREVAVPIADSHGATLGQLCLAWVLGQPGQVHAVAGATSEKQAAENAGTMDRAIPKESLDLLTTAIANCGLDASPGLPMAYRLRKLTGRTRSLGGRILRKIGLR